MKLTRGILVSLEGIDGSGKSSLQQALKAHFATLDCEPIITKEPGGSALGKYLRKLLQEHPAPIASKAEFLLFSADRAQHFHEVIIPALRQGQLIISDRLADSALAYQGYGRGLDKDIIKCVSAWATDGIQPDVVIYIRISPAIALQRCRTRGEKPTSFEKEQQSFFERIHHGYEEMYKDRTNVIVINGDQPQQAVIKDAIDQLMNYLNTHNLIAH